MEFPQSRFQSRLEFCPECGSVLPRPGAPGCIRCPRCHFSIQCSDFEGRSLRTFLEFGSGRAGGGRGAAAAPQGGPTVERRCPRCGNERMSYRTRQMRSADEGQTVFYSCPRCGFQEKEDS
ncbi:DNA-directed RNA polymerase I subunit RPA12 [Poecile atricapillus]|uniref:DNA-directed RNA polymerase I subunit RPA12 n=1 Tax=Poecile atricapillus TaxID=48891 RepID=UPI00273A1C0D|nr:DNA-directed RNA polymerase I subunit RPA12 [Poecile atricapillus]XP_058684994.1 DNA-directed RNA polymerase I subunit RPA12 [Poecile atricapillus]XP_058684995.1 DNA-directed RNA polymerase I subunit RPA12 [Poecile atricapillus]